jgi:hypothetical protein
MENFNAMTIRYITGSSLWSKGPREGEVPRTDA